MVATNKISQQGLSFKKVISIVIMVLGLLLLTGANFIVYGNNIDSKHICKKNADKSDTEAPTPVEEKSKSSNNSLTVQEEYLHDNKHSFKEFAWLNILLRHRIMDAEKLQIVHYELVSPPPKA